MINGFILSVLHRTTHSDKLIVINCIRFEAGIIFAESAAKTIGKRRKAVLRLIQKFALMITKNKNNFSHIWLL
jgi:hypothetical protein